jgi:hypothetical protein
LLIDRSIYPLATSAFEAVAAKDKIGMREFENLILLISKPLPTAKADVSVLPASYAEFYKTSLLPINNYLFNKKKVKLFFTVYFSCAKNIRFITRAPKKVFLLLSDMKFCFMKQLLPRPL